MPIDLFDPDRRALTDKERKRLRRREAERPRGHAHIPGTGPEGETCGSCLHLIRFRQSKVWAKCGLMRAHWTRGSATDVRVRDAACRKWEPPPAADPVPRCSPLPGEPNANEAIRNAADDRQ
ncbi:MAG: hypothetical protein ACK53W_12485 [Gemmatimonadota bacterium]